MNKAQIYLNRTTCFQSSFAHNTVNEIPLTNHFIPALLFDFPWTRKEREYRLM